MDTSTRQRGTQYGSRPNQPASFSGFPSKLRHEVSDDVRGRPSSRPLGSWRSTGPGASTQLAGGSSVVAGRRLFDRNQPRLGASTARHASNSPANTPGKIFNSTGLANGSTPKFTFSPRIPPNAVRESFTTVTPGRSFRASTADLNGRAMSKTSSTNLFPMRIASPPPELDGEELAKQVPDSPDRVGSVYADEFLSHLVPAELDDLQRRQFLCVLDLRRLKYAASEIFAKKDWRVNIMNFAKEYEKSRSLIMLRYGLYEFKTVPASRELLKKWKQENNVPEEDEEMEEAEAPKPNGTSNFRSSVKRRAGDDADFDSATTNKRRVTEREPLTESTALISNAGATPFAKKTKRSAEHLDEADENQPSKKKSSTLSIFEDVANSSPARQGASPTKSAAKKLFAQPPASSRQPLFGAKVSSGNIFGHLSEQNSPEGSEDDDDEEGQSEDAEAEDEEHESQATAPKAAASGAPSLFGTKTLGDATEGGSKGPGLFGRITKGGDGEPVRASGDGAPGLFSTKPPASPPKESQDKTWNPNTPIKFGGAASQPGASLFGTTTTQPSSIFASKPKESTEPAFGSTTPKASAAPAFGIQAQDFAKETPKQAAPSLFGQPSKPSDSSGGLFGNASSIPAFGASTPGQQKSDEKESSAATPATGLFGQSTTASTTPFGKPAETPATQAQPTSIFAGLNKPATTTQASAPSLFGAANDKLSGSLFGAKSDEKSSSTPSLFGAQPSSTSTLFGTKASSGEEKKEESTTKRKKPDSDEAGAVFGSTSAEPASKKYSFGGGAPTPAASLPPKTAEAAQGSTEAGAVFGTGSQDGGKTYSFGSTASSTPAPSSSKPADTPAPAALFGNPTPQAAPAKAQPSIFANAPAPSSGFTFGGASSTPSTNLFSAPSGNDSNTNNITNPQSGFSFGSTGTPAPAPAASSFTFNAGGDQGSFKNPFSGGDAAGVSFDFGATPAQSQAASAPFQFGNAAPAAPASSSFTFGGDSQPATNGPSSSSFTFGGASQPANAAPAPSSNMFGGAQPNGGSSMFNFGGASQAPSQPTSSANMFSGQPANAAQGIFAGSLAPPAGSSTGTSK